MKKISHPDKKKILITDNDEAIIEVLQIILEQAGYDVDTSDGKDVMKKIKISLPDLVLLDLWMPGADGGEICKQIKKDEKTKQISVIMISAANTLAETSQIAGADDYIEKPFTISDLLTKIEKIV